MAEAGIASAAPGIRYRLQRARLRYAAGRTDVGSQYRRRPRFPDELSVLSSAGCGGINSAPRSAWAKPVHLIARDEAATRGRDAALVAAHNKKARVFNQELGSMRNDRLDEEMTEFIEAYNELYRAI